MANPITSIGLNRGVDIVEEAALQDEERRIREDEAHFRLTGENRRPRRLDNPLVDNNPSPNIANDGDDYELTDEDRLNVERGEYVEDSPTEFISGVPSQNTRRLNSIRNISDVEQAAIDIINRFDQLNSTNPNTSNPRDRVMDAYNRREKEKEDKEFAAIKEKRIEQSKNAITELQIDDGE